MSEISKLIAEIKSEGILRAGNKLEQLYSLATELESNYAALHQKLDAMAAENAALKVKVSHLAEDVAQRPGDHEKLCRIQTPATEAYLDSVRAEGAMAARNNIRKALTAFNYEHHGVVAECADMAEMVAQRLRSGTHDTADREG